VRVPGEPTWLKHADYPMGIVLDADSSTATTQQANFLDLTRVPEFTDLKRGRNLLPCKRSSILVLQDYEDLYSRLEERNERYKESSCNWASDTRIRHTSRHVVLCGNPGIGT
jgi:hypothetical protein